MLFFSKKVYCRYYNCLREELEGSEYLSIFFPMNVIRCPRRVGAKYMSISFDMKGEEPQEPIPLVYRVFESELLLWTRYLKNRDILIWVDSEFCRKEKNSLGARSENFSETSYEASKCQKRVSRREDEKF